MTAANKRLLALAAIEPDELVGVFSSVHAKLLRLDSHGQAALDQALEAKRVQTLAQGNLFMTCVLSSAVALSEFKRLPRKPPSGLLNNSLNSIKDFSTQPASLGVYTVACLYALIGQGVWRRIRLSRKKSPTIRA